ncbi:MAG TPA: tripartite tricarboxylate transporter TctB family protein [Burkholderiales bacterium]
MDRVETAAGAIVLALGLSLLVGALRFPFFLEGVPGPGLLPLLIAFGITGAGAALIVQAVRHPTGVVVRWPPASGWARVGFMLGAMAASFLLLDALGFVVVTVLFMAVMVYCLGERSWRIFATVPLLSAIGLYVVFAVWLRVPLPKGIITFLG